MRARKHWLMPITIIAMAVHGCGDTQKPDKPQPAKQTDETGEPTTVPNKTNPSFPVEESDNLPLPEEDKKVVQPIEFDGIWAEALAAAEDGPEIKAIELMGHKWNVKPANISRITTDGVDIITISGRISHHIPFVLDDQVDYVFEFSNGEMTKNDISIKEQPYAAILSQILRIIQKFAPINLPIELDIIDEVISQIEDDLRGDWEDAANRITTKLSLAMYQRKSIKQVD